MFAKGNRLFRQDVVSHASVLNEREPRCRRCSLFDGLSYTGLACEYSASSGVLRDEIGSFNRFFLYRPRTPRLRTTSIQSRRGST